MSLNDSISGFQCWMGLLKYPLVEVNEATGANLSVGANGAASRAASQGS